MRKILYSMFRKQEPVEVVDLNQQIESLRDQLDTLENRKSLEDQLVTLEDKCEETQTKLETAQNALETAKAATRVANNKLGDVEAEHKRADEDVKHMIKINQEANALAMKDFKLTQKGKTAKAIAAVKDEYQNSMEKVLQKQIDDGKQLVAQVLAQLPAATIKIKETR